jgi:hypothetical protein
LDRGDDRKERSSMNVKLGHVAAAAAVAAALGVGGMSLASAQESPSTTAPSTTAPSAPTTVPGTDQGQDGHCPHDGSTPGTPGSDSSTESSNLAGV